MKKYLPLLILLVFTLVSFNKDDKTGVGSSSDFASNSETLLAGNWVLVKIEAPDSIDIVPRSVATEGLRISSEKTATIPYERVVLKSYLEKQLKIYVTKFTFKSDNRFDFFRNEKLTYSGHWRIHKKELFFEYISAGEINTKINKLLKVDAKELILESESHNKPITLYFNRQ